LLYAWIRGNGYDNTINFSIEGHRYALCVKEIPTVFGLANNDFHRADIANERAMVDNELAPLYFLGNESNYGTIDNLLLEFVIFNKIFRGTLTPKRGDRSHINGSTCVFLLAILDNRPPLCISVFFWTEMLYMLKHGSSYVIYAPYIQKIINYKTDMEFEYDGDHSVYLPQLVRTPHTAPSSAAATATTSSLAHDPPVIGHVPISTPDSSRAASRRSKKQYILVKGLKTLISMCCSNNALIYESHQQMSQSLSLLEEHQREMHTSMGFETPEPVVYPPLPPPAVEDSWAWYNKTNGDNDDDNEIKEGSE
jgi:hypothetical protein